MIKIITEEYPKYLEVKVNDFLAEYPDAKVEVTVYSDQCIAVIHYQEDNSMYAQLKKMSLVDLATFLHNYTVDVCKESRNSNYEVDDVETFIELLRGEE